jgi:hypothetical protein
MNYKNTSKIIRVRHDANFTQLSNEMLRDKNLSWKSKGLLSCLMSLPDEWVILKTALHQFAKDGRDSTTAAFNELIDNGYVKQFSIRDSKGRFARIDYIVSDIKLKDTPITENQKSGNPISDNTQVINNVELNTLGIKNEEINNSSTSIAVYANTITEQEYDYLINSIKSTKY